MADVLHFSILHPSFSPRVASSLSQAFTEGNCPALGGPHHQSTRDDASLMKVVPHNEDRRIRSLSWSHFSQFHIQAYESANTNAKRAGQSASSKNLRSSAPARPVSRLRARHVRAWLRQSSERRDQNQPKYNAFIREYAFITVYRGMLASFQEQRVENRENLTPTIRWLFVVILV